MQILGLLLLGFVVSYGFADRPDAARISAFDLHAAVIVLGGSLSAVLVSSRAVDSLRTLACVRELLPGLGTLQKGTDALEAERAQIVTLWREGRRAAAVEVAERSAFPAVQRLLQLVLERAPEEATRAAYTELRHDALRRWQPAVGNWEVLAKLAPSFGMVGTITGMVALFRNMGGDTDALGAAISMALLATLYGVAFGAGVAGPVGHFLRGLLDERVGAIERCEQSVAELVSRSARSAGAA